MIETQWDRTTLARQQIGDAGGSILGSIRRKYSLAKDYKQVAAHLFFVVEVSLSGERKTPLNFL